MRTQEILIVANETAGGRHLRDAVVRAMRNGPCRFTLVVPATRPHGTLTWTDHAARALAEQRLEAALEGLRETGANVRGIVGDPLPLDAVADAVQAQPYDEIIVSTFPHGVSRWLKSRLPEKIRRRFGVRVTHVEADEGPLDSTTSPPGSSETRAR